MSDSRWPHEHSTPGFLVLHQFIKFAQTHVHWVGDAIQLSHPLSSPFPPALNLSQHQGLFQWVGSSHQMDSTGASASASVLPMNIQMIFRRFYLVLENSDNERYFRREILQLKNVLFSSGPICKMVEYPALPIPCQNKHLPQRPRYWSRPISCNWRFTTCQGMFRNPKH